MSPRTTQLSQDLLSAIAQETERLASFSDNEASRPQSAEKSWSRKQELGHLLDSATNNRVRFATAALAGSYTGSTYDGDGWVTLGGYQQMPWNTILQLWSDTNTALASLIANIPDDKLTAHCQVGESPAVTLGFLIEDYILHLQHHLDHVLGREVSTSYPGANMGV